jgi:hypothetical protein
LSTSPPLSVGRLLKQRSKLGRWEGARLFAARIEAKLNAAASEAGLSWILRMVAARRAGRTTFSRGFMSIWTPCARFLRLLPPASRRSLRLMCKDYRPMRDGEHPDAAACGAAATTWTLSDTITNIVLSSSNGVATLIGEIVRKAAQLPRWQPIE